jgi:hypothetical protein
MKRNSLTALMFSVAKKTFDNCSAERCSERDFRGSPFAETNVCGPRNSGAKHCVPLRCPESLELAESFSVAHVLQSQSRLTDALTGSSNRQRFRLTEQTE